MHDTIGGILTVVELLIYAASPTQHVLAEQKGVDIVGGTVGVRREDNCQMLSAHYISRKGMREGLTVLIEGNGDKSVLHQLLVALHGVDKVLQVRLGVGDFGVVGIVLQREAEATNPKRASERYPMVEIIKESERDAYRRSFWAKAGQCPPNKQSAVRKKRSGTSTIRRLSGDIHCLSLLRSILPRLTW